MNQDEFLTRFMPLQPQMQCIAQRLLRSEQDSEDAVQEVFVRMWQQRDALSQKSNMEGYIVQSLKNYCLSLLRHENRFLSDSVLEELTDEAVRREVELNEERAAKLDELMSALPEVQRKAVRMKYIDCLSHEEMQRRLHLSSSNVYTVLSRAISSMKKMLSKN